MRTVEYSGTVKALSSIAHGGKDVGTTHQFRRERLIQPDGRDLGPIPVVSGSVIRGGLRRYAATMTHVAAAGDGRLPFPAVHALRTGGSLRETRTKRELLTGERQARLRDLIPMLGVFGVTGGGRIMSGRLVVDKAIPVAAETAFLAPHYGVDLSGYTPPVVWTLVQREQHARWADVLDAKAQPYVDPETVVDLGSGAGTMIWSTETLPAGTLLFHRFILEDATPVEVSFFDDLMAGWARKARIGAQRARGNGMVETRYTRTVTDSLGNPADVEECLPWREHMTANADEVLEALSWL